MRLAEARQGIVTRTGMPRWSELEQVDREVASHAAQAFLGAAATAGIVFAAVDAGDLRAPRATANVRDIAGRPLDGDDYAAWLADQAIRLPAEDRLPVLAEGEASAVAALLDELAAVYPAEAMGQLARELAVRIYDRLGI